MRCVDVWVLYLGCGLWCIGLSTNELMCGIVDTGWVVMNFEALICLKSFVALTVMFLVIILRPLSFQKLSNLLANDSVQYPL